MSNSGCAFATIPRAWSVSMPSIGIGTRPGCTPLEIKFTAAVQLESEEIGYLYEGPALSDPRCPESGEYALEVHLYDNNDSTFDLELELMGIGHDRSIQYVLAGVTDLVSDRPRTLMRLAVTTATINWPLTVTLRVSGLIVNPSLNEICLLDPRLRGI